VTQRSVLLALLAVQLCFATAPVAVKIALRELSSPALALLRVAGATLLFVVLQRLLTRERIRSRGDYARLAWYAVFGVVANQLLYITGLTRTGATTAQTIVTAGPALTLLVAILLQRETATAGKWLGIGLATLGTLFLVGTEIDRATGVGNLLILLNVLAFSIYLVTSRDLLKHYSPLTVVTWVFCFGLLGMLPIGLRAAVAEVPALSLTTWLAVGWIVLVPTVGAYYLNQWSLQRVEASVVAVYAYLQPVGTALLAYPMLGERPTLRLLPAALIIFVGVALAAGLARRPPPPPSV
jgi:drug/metabolite transporter (DMT)-like permease